MSLFDAAKNFAKVTVSTGYDAAATSIALTSGHGARLPDVPFNATWWNSTDYPDPGDDPNVEIVRVTARATETLTVTRAQESTSASTKNTASKTYSILAGPTAKLVNVDIPAAIANEGTLYFAADYGITPGSADNTAALQAVINTIASLSDNATIIFEEEGPYIFASPLQDTSRSNCIVQLPSVGILSKQYSILLKGGMGRVTFSPSVYSAIPLPAGTRIKCTTNTGTGSFIGGIGPVGDNPGNNTYVCPGFENLIFLMPHNPVISGINLSYFTNTYFRDTAVIAGNTQYISDLVEPTTATSYGVIHPNSNSGVNQRVEGVLNIMGFYNGLRVGEGSIINDVGVWACKNGFVYEFSHGGSRIIRALSGWCPTVIDIRAQHHLIIDELDLERFASGWYAYVREVNDPTNVGRGELRYKIVLANVGWQPGAIIVNGAENMYIREIGEPPFEFTVPECAELEVGMVNDTTVIVQFSEPVKAVDFKQGVSIEINGTPATISTATRQVDKSIVRYLISPAVTGGDAVTFIYEAIDGFIQNEQGINLADCDEPVQNNVGGAPILFDAFTDTNGTLLTAHTMNIGPGWTKMEGGANDPQIQSNKLQPMVDGAVAYTYFVDAADADVIIQCDFVFPVVSSGHHGEIIFRASTLANCFHFILNDSASANVSIVRELSASTVTVDFDTLALTAGTTYTMIVTLSGTSIICTVGGITLTATETFNQTATICGLRFYSPTASPLNAENFQVTS